MKKSFDDDGSFFHFRSTNTFMTLENNHPENEHECLLGVIKINRISISSKPIADDVS